MKLGLVFVGIALVSLGFSQAPKKEALGKAKVPKSSSSREAEIWGAFNDRLTTQIDVWFKDGEFLKAIQIIGAQYELDPKDYEVATNLAWMLENVEEWDKGLAVYKRYAKDNADSPDAFQPLAESYFLKRKFTEAIAVLSPIVGKVPKLHPNMYRMLGTSYERVKKYKEAIPIWEMYIKLAPNDGQAKVNLERVKSKLATSAK